MNLKSERIERKMKENVRIKSKTNLKTKLTSVLLAGMMIAGMSTSTSLADNQQSLNRIQGYDRYATSLAINNSISTSGKVAIIASGENYADSLSAQGLVKSTHGKLYLTEGNAASTKLIAQMKKDGIQQVIVVGGPKAISSRVYNILRNNFSSISRISGKSRYETNTQINNEINKKSSPEFYVYVNGENYADSLSAVNILKDNNARLVLIPNNGYVESKAYSKDVIVGGLVKGNKSIPKIAGRDRYETSLKTLQAIKSTGNHLHVASGRNYADALSLSTILMNKDKQDLLLIDGRTNLTLAQREAAHKYDNITVYGGVKSITTSTANQLLRNYNPNPSQPSKPDKPSTGKYEKNSIVLNHDTRKSTTFAQSSYKTFEKEVYVDRMEKRNSKVYDEVRGQNVIIGPTYSRFDNQPNYIIGHNPGAMADVATMKLGDIISITGNDGKTYDYKIVDKADFRKSERFVVSGELAVYPFRTGKIGDKYSESIFVQYCDGNLGQNQIFYAVPVK